MDLSHMTSLKKLILGPTIIPHHINLYGHMPVDPRMPELQSLVLTRPNFGQFSNLIRKSLTSLKLRLENHRDPIEIPSLPLLIKLEISNCQHPITFALPAPPIKSLTIKYHNCDLKNFDRSFLQDLILHGLSLKSVSPLTTGWVGQSLTLVVKGGTCHLRGPFPRVQRLIIEANSIETREADLKHLFNLKDLIFRGSTWTPKVSPLNRPFQVLMSQECYSTLR